jgi:hypothetical protein
MDWICTQEKTKQKIKRNQKSKPPRPREKHEVRCHLVTGKRRKRETKDKTKKNNPIVPHF